MILTDQQVIELIEHPENSEAILVASELQDAHKVHVNGKGYKKYIRQILGYENNEQYAQKKELSECITIFLTKIIIDQQSRWQNVKGTKKYYNFARSARKEKEFNSVLSQVWKNESIEYFINEFIKDALYTEFNGFVIGELPQIVGKGENAYEIKDGIIQPLQDKLKPYLIFRPIETIHDFRSKGNKVEYIIIDWGKEERDTEKSTNPESGSGTTVQLYRILDDKSDRIFEKGKGKIILSTKYPPIPNKLDYVPAVQVSIFRDDVLIDEIKTSPIRQIIPLLKTYLTNWAEHVITCILHSRPIYYQIGQQCRYRDKDGQCENGFINYVIEGKPKIKTCPDCKGVGAKIYKDAAEALILPQVDLEGKPYNISNVAGYVEPPVETMKQQMNELRWLEENILLSGTGMNKMAETQIEKTATEAMLNWKPLEKIIGDILDNIEYLETEITNIIGKLYYGQGYESCQISYNRNLNLRDENTVLIEIEQAKKAGASSSYVKTLHNELIYSRYQHNPIDLERNLILAELEPLIGYTPEELQKYCSNYVDENTITMKIYFNDYITRFENEHGKITDYQINKDLNKRIKSIGGFLDKYNKEIKLSDQNQQTPS